MDSGSVQSYLEGLGRFGIKFGLGRVRELLKTMKNPHLAYRTVHVAGSNGKGSVSKMIACILEEAGYRTGLYTSPHLERFNERISVNGEEITDRELSFLAGTVRTIVEKMAKKKRQCTYFEATTAIAFEHFRRQKVDVAVIEVGLGGRLDATNVIDPELSVITNISLEHTDWLGNTLEEIAAEKCGIIKKGRPVVTAAYESSVVDVIRKTAKKKNCDFFMMQREVRRRPIERTLEGQRFSIYTDEDPYRDMRCVMSGDFQLDNAALAILAVELLAGLIGQKGYFCYGVSPKSGPPGKKGGKCGALPTRKPGISALAIRRGIGKSRLPARMEFFPGRPAVLLDSAHNPAAARRAAREVRALSNGRFRAVHLMFGNLNDKDFAGVLTPLLEMSDSITFVQCGSERSVSADEAKLILGRMEKRAKGKMKGVLSAANYFRDVASGVLSQMERAGQDDLVLIAGSMYAVGEARSCLFRGRLLK